MLNPADNKQLNCFVKESKIDNGFKLTMYPRWSEAHFNMSNEFAKTKEIYYKVTTEPRIRAKIDANPLDLIKLHHDLSKLTDTLINEHQKITVAYSETLMKTFDEFAKNLDQKVESKTALRIERQFKPYVKKAEEQRRSIFESFQKNLVDGLLWEHTSLDNRRVEQDKPH